MTAMAATPRAADGLRLDLASEPAVARASGALWLEARRILIVADLHLGKSERLARRGGPLLPPYEGLETLARLGAEIEALEPAQIISLGDGFDDRRAARDLDDGVRDALLRLMAGRRWLWILGNHDPHAPELGGDARHAFALGPLVLRHEAAGAPPPGHVEISAHYHPKARLTLRGRRLARRCFVWDGARLILPAFGAYTGGLDIGAAVFDDLLSPNAQALVLSGKKVLALPRCRAPGSL